MDSVTHIRIANMLLKHAEDTCGVKLEPSSFVYGNLKPDLTCTYLKKRHNPSVMMEDVVEKIRVFTENYKIGPENGADLSVDLGEICHFVADFFTYPHNDDIYPHNLFIHYVYEKRASFVVRRKITEQTFHAWADTMVAPLTYDALIVRFRKLHEGYRTQKTHGIDDDFMNICKMTSMVLLAIINICYEQTEEENTATA